MKKSILWICALLAASCQHAPAPQTTTDKEARYLFEQRETHPLYLVKEGFRRYNAEKFAQTSKDILKILRDAGVPSKNKKNYVLYDLFCHVEMGPNGESPKSQCTYFTQSRDQKNRVKKAFAGERAEDLRGILSEFPVNQGDPGATTEYLSCHDSGNEPSCAMAIDLNYAGP